MIAQLTGTIARRAGGFVILDVNGVGYKVSVPLSVLENLPPDDEGKDGNVPGGQPKVTLVTHLIVREDDLSLYGFGSDTELRAFELLLTVSGVGPKVALALLSALTVEDLAHAIADEDVRTLTRVPGVGAKTAQRMVLELKDKFAALGFENKMSLLASGGGRQPSARKTDDALGDVVSALTNLGYNKAEAERAAKTAQEEKAKENDGAPVEFALLLRAALNRLTGGPRSAGTDGGVGKK